MLLLHKEEARRAATRANTFQIRRREVGGANGRPQGPQPRIPASPAPTIDGLGGPLRRIVGEPCLGDRYSGERIWRVGPCGRPCGVQFTPTPLFEMYWPQGPPLYTCPPPLREARL